MRRVRMAAVSLMVAALILAGCQKGAPPPAPAPLPTGAAPSTQEPARRVTGEVASVEQAETGPVYTDVFFPDGRHGWVTGTRCEEPGCPGFVLATADGGQTWTRADLDAGTGAPRQVLFVSGEEGFALTENALLATEDGGRTWAERSQIGKAESWSQISFSDPQHGLARTDQRLMATADGGRTWQNLHLPGEATAMAAAVDPSQAGHLWAIGVACAATPQCRVGIYASGDSGKTWAARLQVPVEGERHEAMGGAAIAFVGAEGWVLLPTRGGCTMGGCWGPLYHTADGGQHWEQLRDKWNGGATSPPGWPGRLSFTTGGWGWVGARGGAGPGQGGVGVSRDGGQTWERTGSEAWQTAAVAPVGPGEAWAVGQRRNAGRASFLVHTTDGGRTWEQVLPVPGPAAGIDFVDGQHGFGIGTLPDLGAILATDDGGKTWRQTASLPGFRLTALSFATARTGLVAGVTREGKEQLLRTEDGGGHWAPVDETQDPVAWLRLIDEQHGLRVTQSFAGGTQTNTLSTTADGGRTWSAAGTVPPELSPICFWNGQRGFGMRLVSQEQPGGPGVALALTQDGGKTWENATVLPPTAGLTAGCRGEQQGWVAGGPLLLRTLDGGATWHTFTLPNLDVISAALSGPQDGWVLTREGQLYRSADGGTSWKPAAGHQP